MLSHLRSFPFDECLQGLAFFHLFTLKARAGPPLRRASLLRGNYIRRSRRGSCRSKCNYLLSNWGWGRGALSTRPCARTAACPGQPGWAARGAGGALIVPRPGSLENARKWRFLRRLYQRAGPDSLAAGRPGQISSFSRTIRKPEKAADGGSQVDLC